MARTPGTQTAADAAGYADATTYGDYADKDVRRLLVA